MNDYTADYAKYYGLLTGHKSYHEEIQHLLRLLNSKGFDEYTSVLSVGCGIGSHERLLAKHVGSVMGIDQSPHMINYGQQMVNPSNLILENKDLAHIEAAPFDVVISLFNVVNCISAGSSLDAFFKEIAYRVKSGGLVVLESWNQKATISTPPTKVTREYSSDGISLSRTALPHLDSVSSTLRLEYLINGVDHDNIISIVSIHDLYLHSIQLIESHLIANGFSCINWYTALSDGMNILCDDTFERMLLVSATKI